MSSFYSSLRSMKVSRYHIEGIDKYKFVLETLCQFKANEMNSQRKWNYDLEEMLGTELSCYHSTSTRPCNSPISQLINSPFTYIPSSTVTSIISIWAMFQYYIRKVTIDLPHDVQGKRKISWKVGSTTKSSSLNKISRSQGGHFSPFCYWS